MKRKFSVIILALMILIISLSCNLPISIKQTAETGDSGSSDSLPSQDSSDAGPDNSPFTQNSPDAEPVPIQAGLASLDSYQSTFIMNSSGSNGTYSRMQEEIESSIIDGNSHLISTNASRDEGETEDSSSTEETFKVGPVTCTLSDGEWSYSKQSDLEKELADSLSKMIDFVPVIENPEFVSEETVNGIQANHFSFKVNGIGDSSGAVATQNQGDYWLAVDGNYLVKYHLILQIQTAPEGNESAEISNMEISYDLRDINVPIVITQPADCVPTD